MGSRVESLTGAERMARKTSRRNSLSSPLAEWVESLPESFVLCRDIGHTWKPLTAQWVPADHVFYRTLRCPRCHTERVQTLSATGRVLAGHYLHPQGYLAPKGHGHITQAERDSLRLHSVTRSVEQAKDTAA